MTSMTVPIHDGATIGQKVDAALAHLTTKMSPQERTQVKLEISIRQDGSMSLVVDGSDEIVSRLKSALS